MNEREDAGRIQALEEKLSYAEDLIETLNATVFRQQQQIDLLQRQFRLLHQQFQEVKPAADAEPRDLRDEIPPHY
jgi:SlyX protein